MHVYQKTIKTLLAKLNALDSNQQSELQKLKFDEEEKYPTATGSEPSGPHPDSDP